MALSDAQIYNGDGSTRDFTILGEILSESHLRVWIDDVLQSSDDWDLLGNTVLFNDAPDDGANVQFLVSTTGTDFPSNPSAIGDVAININDIITVAANIGIINTTSTNINDVIVVSSNIDNVNGVASNKTNIDNVVNNKTNIDTVANNKTNIDTIGENISNVINVSNNIEEVKILNTAIEDGVLPFERIVVTVNNIDELLEVSPSNGDTVIVKDLIRGGTFIYNATQSAVNNGGTIFNGWVRQYSGAVNVKWFGAKGDGVTDDGIAIDTARGSNPTSSLYIPSGVYKISQNSLEFYTDVVFEKGSVLNVVENGSIVLHSVTAGDYVIFNSDQDFETTFEQDTKIKILYSTVNANWFCIPVKGIQDIKNVPDQTNNMLKAFRASAGNFIAQGPANHFLTEYASGCLELGVGYYRIDGTFTLGGLKSPYYYKVNGFSFKGKGAGSSFLMRTDMTSEDMVFMSFFTAERTDIGGFKLAAYNPDGTTNDAKFNSHAKSMMFLQGDSLTLYDIWVAGAQTSIVDTNGLHRNGIGIQFNSCVDTYMQDVWVEFCETGIAFGSSIVSGNNIEIYTTRRQAIGIGNFISNWPDTQTTSSRVSLSHIQAPAVEETAITILENGTDAESFLNINTSYFNGYNSEFGYNTGVRFMYVKPNVTIKPNITNTSILNFTYKVFDIQSGASFGDVNKPSLLTNSIVKYQNSITLSGVFKHEGSVINLYVNGCSFVDISGVLYSGAMIDNNSQVTFRDCYLSRYTGQEDSSVNRALCSGAGNINFINLTRNISDTVVLSQVGYWASGTIFVDIPTTFTNLTRTINGSATKLMPTLTTFA